MLKTRWIRWFSDVGMADLPVVGGKNASLGEMIRKLGPLGLHRRRRLLFCDRRGPADCELRGATGELPRRPWRCPASGVGQEVLCESVHPRAISYREDRQIDQGALPSS